MTMHPDIYFAMHYGRDVRLATQHFCFAGAAGTGKTTFIKLMMQEALSRMGHSEFPDTRAFVYDKKGELYPYFLSLIKRYSISEEHFHLLNPFDTRSSWWDIASDMERPKDSEEIARILVPPVPGERDVYYRNMTRHLVGNVILSLYLINGNAWTFRDVILALKTEEDYLGIVRRHEQTAWIADRLGSKETKANTDSTIAEVYSIFQRVAALMDHRMRAGGRRFSVRRWIENPQILLATVDNTATTAIEPFYTMLLYFIKQHIVALPDDKADVRRTWLFLDEFHTLGRIDKFDEFMTTARSKGGCVVLGFQNVETLTNEDRYRSSAYTILGECKNKMFFKAPTVEHAEWCAKEYRMDEFEKITTETSINYGQNYSKHEVTSEVSVGRSTSIDLEYIYTRYPSEFQDLTIPRTSSELFTAYALFSDQRFGLFLPVHQARGAVIPDFPETDLIDRVGPNAELLRDWDDEEREELGLKKKPEQTKEAPQEAPAGKKKERLFDELKKVKGRK